MQFFYDTCSLLNQSQNIFDKPFIISNITLKELENIKTSASKDAEIKFKARKILHLLDLNEDKFQIINYQKDWDNELKDYPILSDNNDSRIILTALKITEPITFMTEDLCCKHLAKSLGLNVQFLNNNIPSDYTGYSIIKTNSDEELATIYQKLFDKDIEWDFNINEYLIIKDKCNNTIDIYKYTSYGFQKVDYSCFDSKMFGRIKPKDEYQQIAMDSFKNNKITMIRGDAGTGKSYLAIGYLFSLLEKGKIDRIIIFCNTVATSGSAKLGYYPGSRTEKLLDSQIGNFLSSKLGDKIEVERLISEGKIILLPMSDIRGYDTSGLNAGIYITEAQNLDIELMRLALQRIGEDSICIIDGDDSTQVDLPIYAGNNNGMKRLSEVFRGNDIYGEVTLKNIYRSKIAALAQLM